MIELNIIYFCGQEPFQLNSAIRVFRMHSTMISKQQQLFRIGFIKSFDTTLTLAQTISSGLFDVHTSAVEKGAKKVVSYVPFVGKIFGLLLDAYETEHGMALNKKAIFFINFAVSHSQLDKSGNQLVDWMLDSKKHELRSIFQGKKLETLLQKELINHIAHDKHEKQDLNILEKTERLGSMLAYEVIKHIADKSETFYRQLLTTSAKIKQVKHQLMMKCCDEVINSWKK